MATNNQRYHSKMMASNRAHRKIELPRDEQGNYQKISDYYETNIFDFRSCETISQDIKDEIIEVYKSRKPLSKEHAMIVADAASEWALGKGATHFCHWFQPLTGVTAEKHDSFLDFFDLTPVDRLSPSRLMQGEPDASSFPHGGSRTTFEARGYTTWDLTSPMFLMEGINGKTLCIPTAFISYTGEALDTKTPLLRSIDALKKRVMEYLHLAGDKDVNEIFITCGAEQEYFLIDKAFYHLRPDIVVSGSTLIGKNSSKDQQLSDHYFGTIPQRVLAFMQELDYELHKLGIPSQTRHNEVAPGQFEIAPRFTDANLAADHNQLIMAKIKETADTHNFVALLHEKPFKKINGSGKHLNWSMGDNLGRNLLDPGDDPHKHFRFLGIVAAIIEAVHEHADMLRVSTATISNDCRLGGHEAPPSIISIFLGDTLDSIFTSIANGCELTLKDEEFIDLKANELAQLSKDTTDRNRTSPFAFTGNRFEFRAVGSSQSIGIPLSIMNGALASSLGRFNGEIKRLMDAGKSFEEATLEVIKESYKKSSPVVYNGDGYDLEWVKEAKRRGLPNLKNTIEALAVLKDEKATEFLIKEEIYSTRELQMRYNIFNEHYYEQALINMATLLKLINQNVIPYSLEYKDKLLSILSKQEILKIQTKTETKLFNQVCETLDNLSECTDKLELMMDELPDDPATANQIIVNEFNPLAEVIREYSDKLEVLIPDTMWKIPRYFDLLFIR